MGVDKEYKINEHIQLRLEGGKTNIYLGNELFSQCKHLFIFNPHQKLESKGIDSIDDAAEYLRSDSEENISSKDLGISPEEEFWGHCSNLQAWVESDYNSKILHYSLSFPLLKKLAKNNIISDIKYLEEVFIRLKSKNDTVIAFLIQDPYLKRHKNDELLFHILSIDEYQALRDIFVESLDSLDFKIGRLDELNLDRESYRVGIVRGYVRDLVLENMGLKEIPKSFSSLKFLERVWMGNNQIQSIPDNVGELRELTTLDLFNNRLEEIPSGIFDLKNLEYLDVSFNKIKILSSKVGNLEKLEVLRINGNSLEDSEEIMRNLIKKLTKIKEITI